MKQMIKKSISVFLPTLNEQENIKTCVLSIKKYLSKRFEDYEILVISGGSTDNTEKIVRDLAKRDKRILLISQKKNLGYGAALRSGFSRSSKELVFYTDADNQFNIKDLDILLPLLTSFDIVAGFRINRQDPLMRIFVAWVYNMFIRILFNLDVLDIDASFKLYKKDVFKKIKLKANTGLIDAEILIKAKKNGFSIGQIGVKHYPRTKGKTVYEMGNRNKIVAFVKPRVIIDVLSEIRNLWSDLR
ncbi:MAG: glycosyltransferase family 2 protein [Patescibacteria group bacterium]|nr:glycosyltransferase family 2 protein [Patescibacteria group bacterium]